ncbi:hypothetical protein [Micromonospora sp. NPDC004551]|uniref:hypothetical protein n=1 Tax=Micromonospora sp. NPDC004551 TaxID=3154284 RepID=UPI0033A5DCFD
MTAAARIATVLVSAGTFAVAARLDLGAVAGTGTGRESIVDDWSVRPVHGRPVSVLVVRTPGRYTLTIAHLLDFALVHQLDVTTDQQAREAARHLIRAVVNGVVPAEPRTPDELATWRVAATTIARIVARTWPEQPRGR